MPDVGWCDNCNVPVIDVKKCGLCNSRTHPIRSHELKPIFNKEKMFLREILKRNNFEKTLIPEGMCFCDHQGYVIANGVKIFRASFNEERNIWSVKLTKDASNGDAYQGSDPRKVVAANIDILKKKEKASLRYLRSIYRRYHSLPFAVSFSGGKDSVTTLAITRKVKRNIDVVFLNTTIELPETVQYTRKLAKLWRLNLIEGNPTHDFFELCRVLGPPSRLMKWCCKTQKFSPMNKLIHERYRNGVVMIRGVRAAESENRSNYTKMGKMKYTPKEIVVNPILDWSSLDTWMYIFWKRIPYNKAYEYGFARIGCWVCPAKSPKDLELVSKAHPELRDKLYEILDSYASRYNMDRGLFRSWAWRRRKSRISKTTVCATKPCLTSNDFVFSVDDPQAIRKVAEWFKVVGDLKELRGKILSTQKDEPMWIVNGKYIDASIVGTSVRVRFKDEEKEDLILRLIERALNCIACGACQASCSRGAIKQVDGKIIIYHDRCIKCLQCLKFSCISLKYGRDRLSVSFTT